MRQQVVKSLYLSAGYIALGLGIVGIFLPIMPTVPFLIVAAFCFSRGSEKMHRWLLDHPIFGHPIRDWHDNRIIRPRAKAVSAFMIGCGVISVWTFLPASLLWLRVGITVLMVLAIAFILSQRSK